MPVSVRISPEEYLATSYRPDCDYIDGEVVERNVGEWDHSRLQGLVAAYLCSRERQWCILVLLAQRLQISADRFRVADVVVVTENPDEQTLTSHRFCA